MGTRRIGRLAGPLLGMVILVAALTQAGAQPAAETTPPATAPSAPSAPSAGPPRDLPAGPPDAPRFLLEAVRVEPPGGEAEFLVRRNLHLHPGQMVDAATLVQTRQYLAATGLFAELDLYTTRGSRFGAVIAVVVARARHSLRVEIGAGRDPGRGWYWTVLGLRRPGLFGRGGVAQVSYRMTRRSAGLYADLDIPSLIARDADLLVSLSAYRDTWTIRQGDSTHFQRIDGARFRVGARRWVADDLSATLWGGVAQTHPRRTVQGEHGHPKIPAAGLVPVYKDDLRLGEAQLDLLRNGRDRLRPWQNGSWAQWILRGSTLCDGQSFWGSELDTRLAVPVADTRAAAFRFRVAYVSADTPYFLRPIVGGLGSLRGFSEGEVSGPLGARALCSVSAEWRHSLIGFHPRQPRVTATVFVDAGDHWTASGGHADPAAGAGLGVLVRVPWLQVVNVEAAYPLTDQVKGHPVVFYLSLGRSF
jgi:outer membrane protein assembly factor BamA